MMPDKIVKKIIIDDVAKVAGVSKGTVSAVINNKNSVKPETRDHVLLVMRKLNFRPKCAARYLKTDLFSKNIGIIVKDLITPSYAMIATGAKDYADRRGYSILLSSSDDNPETEKKFFQLFSVNDIKGTILSPVVAEPAEIEHLFRWKMINYPFVLLEAVKGINANVVAIDNRKAVKTAVKYLIDCGHRNIVHFAGPRQSSCAQERIEGFRHAFSESTLVFNADAVVYIGSNYKESFLNTIEYFKRKNRADFPSAIICFNDQQALSVMMALKELSIRVPDDISLIGNDHVEHALFYPVPLTTIHAPHRQIGEKAAEIIIDNIESSTPLPARHIVLETDFMIRGSTKAVNG